MIKGNLLPFPCMIPSKYIYEEEAVEVTFIF